MLIENILASSKKYVPLQSEMRYRTLRHIASIVLLAIYLPITVLSSLHVHHETVDSHDDCLQCVGHFEARHYHEHDCLYCHFIGLYYLGESSEQSTVDLPAAERIATPTLTVALSSCHGVVSLRAPPTA